MPYIRKDARCKFDEVLSLFAKDRFLPVKLSNPGEFNYLVSKLCQIYIQQNGESYQSYNDLMGALTGVNLELYRRHIQIYEDSKIAENGDI